MVLKTERDYLWFDEGIRMRYQLPSPASSWKRLWGIRHWRAFWRAVRDEIDAWSLARNGIVPLGYHPWVTYAVARGWV